MGKIESILVALTLSGCTLMTNDYSAAPFQDAGQDRDAASVDGRDEVLRDCTPATASGTYSLLRGPSHACGDLFCESWIEMCLVEDRHYLVLQTDGQLVRWFDRCNLEEFGSVNGTVICTSADGYTVSIGAQGRQVTDAPGGFIHDWSLYHRSVTDYEFLASTNGCGEPECEMFSGFQLDPQHRYLVRQIEQGKVRWFDNCRLENVGTSDELICVEPEEDDDIVVRASAPESASAPAIQGSWTMFSEPIDDGGAHTYMGPTKGCGSSACQMWDNIQFDDGHRYMVLQSGPSGVRWFDSCSGQFQDPDNQKLRCVSPDGHFIELQSRGNETSDADIDDSANWSLLRWSLHQN